jgi:hypothetical protein
MNRYQQSGFARPIRYPGQFAPSQTKWRADWLILALVLSGALFHTPFVIVGVIASFGILLAVCFAHDIYAAKREMLLLAAFLVCYGIQVTLPAENLPYYAISGVLFLIGMNSFTGVAKPTGKPLMLGTAAFALLTAGIMLDPAQGETLFANANAAAAVAISLFTYCMGYSPKIRPLNALLYVALLGLVAMFSGSRGVILFFCFFALTTALALFYDRVAVVAAVIGMAFAYLWVSGDPIVEDVVRAVTGVDSYEIFGRDLFARSGRDELFNYTTQSIGFTWTGIGMGMAVTLLQPFGFELSPHNTFLRIYVEGGVIFLVATLLWLLHMFTRMRNPVLLGLLVGNLMRMMFESAVPFGLSSQSLLLILPYLMSDLGADFYAKARVKVLKQG